MFFPRRKTGPCIDEAPRNDGNASFVGSEIDEKTSEIDEKTSKIMVWGGPWANVAPFWRPGGPKGRQVRNKVVRWTPPPPGRDPVFDTFRRGGQKNEEKGAPRKQLEKGPYPGGAQPSDLTTVTHFEVISLEPGPP